MYMCVCMYACQAIECGGVDGSLLRFGGPGSSHVPCRWIIVLYYDHHHHYYYHHYYHHHYYYHHYYHYHYHYLPRANGVGVHGVLAGIEINNKLNSCNSHWAVPGGNYYFHEANY